MLNPNTRLFLPYCSAWLFAVCIASGAPVRASDSGAIDNAQVHVRRITLLPHVRSAPHRHPLNRVFVYLQAGRERIVSSGDKGDKTVRSWKSGDVRWVPASGTQTSEIISANPVSMVEIELERKGAAGKSFTDPEDPLRAAPEQAKLAFENPQVRVFRVNVNPRQTLGMHVHVVNRVAVYLNDLNERVTTGDGKVMMVRHKAGEPVWGGPIKHREENLSEAPIRAVVIELKN